MKKSAWTRYENLSSYFETGISAKLPRCLTIQPDLNQINFLPNSVFKPRQVVFFTTMKTASSAVFQSEYLSALLSSIDESVVATDKNFLIRYWNKGAEQIFGYSAEETIGKRGSTIMKFEYPNEQEDEARQILVERGQWKGRLNYTDPRGVTRLLEVSVTMVKDDGGELMGYVGVHRDITEYNQTKSSLATFVSIISSVDDNFFVVDKKLKIALVDDKSNENVKQIYGITYAKGDDVITKLPAHRKKKVKECFEKALLGEKIVYQLNTTNVFGHSIWLQASYFPIKDKHGFITHACSLVRDITAQKEIEQVNEKLYRSRKLFETFMENSPLISWIIDSKGILRYINPYFLKQYGLGKEVIGQPASKIFPKHVSSLFGLNGQNSFVIKKKQEATEGITMQDGKKHFYHIIKFPISSNEEEYLGGWALDMTGEINLRESLTESLNRLQTSENELKEALKKEHLLNDMKSRFVSMASHEFRTPLSTILSSTFLIEKYTTTEQQQSRFKHISRVRDAIYHMNNLLEDFLSLGRLEEGKTLVHPTAFNLIELIESIIEETEPFKKTGQIIRYAHKGENNVTTDRKLLRNIIINLLNNALKFSPENKTIIIKSAVSENKTTISIKDHGIGISQEDQKHLFESFYRGKNAQNIQGTGLGLHIVKRYLDLLKGSIKLESGLDKGTTITITLKNQ